MDTGVDHSPDENYATSAANWLQVSRQCSVKYSRFQTKC